MPAGADGYPGVVTTSAKKMRALALAILLAGGAAVAGCGDTDDDTDGGSSGSSSTAEEQVEDGAEQSESGTDEQPDMYNDNENDGEPPSEGEGSESGVN